MITMYLLIINLYIFTIITPSLKLCPFDAVSNDSFEPSKEYNYNDVCDN